MPVNWAFPAAQGEPESFLTIWVSDLLLQKFLMASGFFCSENPSAISIDPLLDVLFRNFLLHAQISSSSPSAACVH